MIYANSASENPHQLLMVLDLTFKQVYAFFQKTILNSTHFA